MPEKWDIHVFDEDSNLDHIVTFRTMEEIANYLDLQSESGFTRFDIRSEKYVSQP